jgi:hypothetical protein
VGVPGLRGYRRADWHPDCFGLLLAHREVVQPMTRRWLVARRATGEHAVAELLGVLAGPVGKRIVRETAHAALGSSWTIEAATAASEDDLRRTNGTWFTGPAVACPFFDWEGSPRDKKRH